MNDNGESIIDLRMLTDEAIERLSNLEAASLVVQNVADVVTMQIQNSLKEQQARVVYFMKRLEEQLKQYNSLEQKSAKDLMDLLQAIRALAYEAEHDEKRGHRLGLSAQEVRVFDELCAVDILSRELTEDDLVKLARQLKDAITDGRSLDAVDLSGKSGVKEQIRRKLLRYRSYLAHPARRLKRWWMRLQATWIS